MLPWSVDTCLLSSSSHLFPTMILCTISGAYCETSKHRTNSTVTRSHSNEAGWGCSKHDTVSLRGQWVTGALWPGLHRQKFYDSHQIYYSIRMKMTHLGTWTGMKHPHPTGILNGLTMVVTNERKRFSWNCQLGWVSMCPCTPGLWGAARVAGWNESADWLTSSTSLTHLARCWKDGWFVMSYTNMIPCTRVNKTEWLESECSRNPLRRPGWWLIWRDHLCPSVVLFGDSLITFLTSCVPAQKKKHDAHHQQTITKHGINTLHDHQLTISVLVLWHHLFPVFSFWNQFLQKQEESRTHQNKLGCKWKPESLKQQWPTGEELHSALLYIGFMCQRVFMREPELMWTTVVLLFFDHLEAACPEEKCRNWIHNHCSWVPDGACGLAFLTVFKCMLELSGRWQTGFFKWIMQDKIFSPFHFKQ